MKTDTQEEEELIDSEAGIWKKKWKEGKIAWHQSKVNDVLLRHYEVLTGQKLPETTLSPESAEFQSNSKKTWFLPLCGKTLDIPFLLSLGYQVFGIELVKQGIEELDKENDLKLEFNEKESLYVGADGRLKLYFGDLFLCPIEKFGPFDYVWDRGSFIALEYSMRNDYKGVMQRSLTNQDGNYHNFAYLLDSIQYDKRKFGGPPKSVEDEDLKMYFEDWTEIQCLENEPVPETHSLRKVEDIGPDVNSRIFIMKPKQI